MEELLRQILEELRADDSPVWWLEVLRIVGPLIGGALVAAIGFFAVHQQNVTQRDNLKQTNAAQAAQQRAERLTAWRHERYGELLAALGEFHAAVRRMNLALNSYAPDPAAKEHLRASLEHFIRVDTSSRILQAAMQVADKEVAELAQKLANDYHSASGQLVSLGITAGHSPDEKALGEAFQETKAQLDKTSEQRYDLNRRIETLISEGD